MLEPARTVRLSLALWARNADDASPSFFGDADRPETLVVVWPTCERGYLLADRVDDAFVTRWVLTKAQFSKLEQLHRHFHLGHHDVLVQGGDWVSLSPCSEALLRRARTRREPLFERLMANCHRQLRSAA